MQVLDMQDFSFSLFSKLKPVFEYVWLDESDKRNWPTILAVYKIKRDHNLVCRLKFF